MELKLEIPKNHLLFITVPNINKKYEIINYGFAGTYIMESNSENLNAWKMKLPNGIYEVIGDIKKAVIDENDLKDVDEKCNFIIRKI